ncbi:Hypothetical predicted protein [Paramuricea clavata]|uniref:Uncharacterized protein n=1 Tax=Paramuricea clavata TaxID=317549 RepID=A0A7D9HHB4_PARCT|nr:Hypothetical predicted protein [Paramuricea clavata]
MLDVRTQRVIRISGIWQGLVSACGANCRNPRCGRTMASSLKFNPDDADYDDVDDVDVDDVVR